MWIYHSFVNMQLFLAQGFIDGDVRQLTESSGNGRMNKTSP